MRLQKSTTLRAGVAAIALTFAMIQTAVATEQDCPEGDLPVSATVEGYAKTIGWIIGVRWGEGTLTLKDGSQYKFTGSGVKLLETGAAKVTFKGNVYNLSKLEDFEGDYAAVSGGLTVVKGLTGGAILKNSNCVYINLEVESTGVRLSAPAPGGVLIKLEEW